MLIVLRILKILLKEKYPYSFWAEPNKYFDDGIKINKGSDFGLMPSLFEPGGIVQHEFFIAGAPVIAFRTGGLKDTVFEFNYEDLFVELDNEYWFL